MQQYSYVAIVTLLTLIVYFWMATQVSRTRTRLGILAPAMTGDPVLERTIRAHLNTLEWLPILLPSLCGSLRFTGTRPLRLFWGSSGSWAGSSTSLATSRLRPSGFRGFSSRPSRSRVLLLGAT